MSKRKTEFLIKAEVDIEGSEFMQIGLVAGMLGKLYGEINVRGGYINVTKAMIVKEGRNEGLHDCPDCGAPPGRRHAEGCDVERCSVCGMYRLGCTCKGHDPEFARWTGLWPGTAEAQFLGIDLNEFYKREYHKIFFVKKAK